jgi:excisionase family DNA binding protein
MAEEVKGILIAGYRMYNVEEVAELLQISAGSVRNYIKKEKLKGQRIGKRVYVSEEALKLFLGV